MSTGRRYHETQRLTLPEIAQCIRADVAELKTNGQLPEHAVVSVRVDQKGTGSGSISIVVSGLCDAEVWRTPGVTEMDTQAGHWGGLTRLGQRITDLLEDLHHAYNYNNSDSMTDYFDVRYYGGVRICCEEDQRRGAQEKARQQQRAAANRAARQAADALPLRATIDGDRMPRLVITDARTGQEVATVPAQGYSREFLTASYVEYLLGTHGWDVVGYRRRSKANPVGYWTVRRPDETAAAQPAEPDPTSEPPSAEQGVDPAEEPRAEDHHAAAADEHVTAPAVLDPDNWADLDPEHWAARWVRNTQTMPADDPARIWSQATATLIAAGYRHERHDAPGHVDHVARLVTTDARTDVADEAAALSRQAAAVLDWIAASILDTDSGARPIVLDGTGLSGIRCETCCGVLARRSVLNLRAEDHTPSRSGYCSACLLAHAHPITPTPADHIATEPTGDPDGPRPEETAESDEFEDVTILHTAETGTLLLGTSKGDGSYAALTRAGQHWRGLRHGEYAGALYLPHTRDRAAKRSVINQAAEVLQAAGWTVQVRIDDTPRNPAAVAADRRQRSASRVERLRARAGSRAAAADAAYDRANQIGERFAGGQRILIGHHSEKRARRDRDRMHAAIDHSCELRGEAERHTAAADAAQLNAKRHESPQLISRRIERNKAEEARIQRLLDDHQRRFRYGTGYLVIEEPPTATGAHREQVLGELAHVRAALAADRQALADLAATGAWRPIDPTTIRPGDLIRARGLWREVVRVNRTTVSVATGYTWTDRVRFAEITAHRSADA